MKKIPILLIAVFYALGVLSQNASNPIISSATMNGATYQSTASFTSSAFNHHAIVSFRKTTDTNFVAATTLATFTVYSDSTINLVDNTGNPATDYFVQFKVKAYDATLPTPGNTTVSSQWVHYVTSPLPPKSLSVASTLTSPTYQDSVFAVSIQLKDSLGASSATAGVSVSLSLNGIGNITGTNPVLTNASGLATFSISIDSVGAKTLTANSAGLTSTTTSSFTIVSYITASTLTGSSSLNPSSYLDAVNIPGNISPANSTDTLYFKSVVMGVWTLLAKRAVVSGTATYSTNSFPTGIDSVAIISYGSLHYYGDTAYVVQTVNKANPGILAFSTYPTVLTFGQTDSLKFTGFLPTVTGTVDFYDSTTSTTFLGTAIVSAGQAVIPYAGFTGGLHHIFVNYSGDINYRASVTVPPGYPVVVNQAIPAMGPLSVSQNPSVCNTSVDFMVSSQAGWYVLHDAGIPVDSVNLTVAGLATISHVFTSVGPHSMDILYKGNANYLPAPSNTIIQTVTKAHAVVSFSSSAITAPWGQNITFTEVLVSGATGNGNFYKISSGVWTQFSTGAFVSGAITGSINNLPIGSDSVALIYSGDVNHFIDTTYVVETIVQASTSSTLSSSSLTAPYYTVINYTDSIFPSAASGTVSFYDTTGGSMNLLGIRPIVSGIAVFTDSLFSVGTHHVLAVYGGNTNYLSDTSNEINEVITQQIPTVVLSVSPSSSVLGQNITMNTHVLNPNVTNPVEFYDGAILLTTLPLVGDSALFTTSALSTGVHNLKAKYLGDMNYVSQMSNIVAHTVITVNLSGSASSVFGALTVPITLSVSSVIGTNGTGSIYDTLGGVWNLVDSGAIVNGIFMVNASPLSVGPHYFVGVRSANANYIADTTAVFVHTVNQYQPNFILAQSSGISSHGSNVNFTVTGIVGNETGPLALYDGVNLIGTITLPANSFSVSTLSVGVHNNLHLVYAGDLNNLPFTSLSISHTVLNVFHIATANGANPLHILQYSASSLIAYDGFFMNYPGLIQRVQGYPADYPANFSSSSTVYATLDSLLTISPTTLYVKIIAMGSDTSDNWFPIVVDPRITPNVHITTIAGNKNTALVTSDITIPFSMGTGGYFRAEASQDTLSFTQDAVSTDTYLPPGNYVSKVLNYKFNTTPYGLWYFRVRFRDVSNFYSYSNWFTRDYGVNTTGIKSSTENTATFFMGQNIVFPFTRPVELQVCNILGEVVIHQIVQKNDLINMDNLPAGVYLYQLVGEGRKVSGKIVKM